MFGDSQRSIPYADVFVGDGEMAQLMRAHDWDSTTLGNPQGWSSSLKAALRLLLTSRFEMWLGWGPEINFFYNDAYRPTLGIKHPRSLGTPTQELWPEIWDDIKDRLATVYQRGEATWDRALLLLLERNGYPEETYHTFSYSPLIDDDGTVQGVFCAVSEETDRVISERRMASLQQLAAGLAVADSRAMVFASSQMAMEANQHDLPFGLIYIFNKDGGADLVAASAMNAGEPGAPATLAASEDLWNLAAVRAGSTDPILGLCEAGAFPSGAWDRPPIHAATVPLVAQGGRPFGALVVGLNPYRPEDRAYLPFLSMLAGQITSALSNADAVEADRAERDRMRVLFQQAPSFMCILSGPNHVFELVNDAYLQLAGHRDLIGLGIRDALPEVAGQGYFELLDRVLESGEAFIGRNMQVHLQRTPGAPLDERFVHLVYQPIIEDDGSVSGIFVDGHDVTHQKRAQDQLELLNQTLEERVNERTDELSLALSRLQKETLEREQVEAALRQSQKIEALGKLTGGVAHDFNNLLQVISGNLQLLSRDLAGNERAEKRVHNALAGVSRGAKLASQLLAFGRRQPLEPKVLNLGKLLSNMDDLLRRSLGEDIEIETIVGGGLWNTLVDPGQIENAILNLAINARDAMEGGGRLTIETGNAALDDDYARQHGVAAGQYVMMAVTDTGSGIPQDIIEQVFEPFFSTKAEGKGTGLGLSMVHGLVKQSGGHIKVYSEPGEGTTIKLYLPRAAGSEDVLVDLSETVVRGGSETVLVVEDDDDVREAAVGLLSELGYRVLKARDASSALVVVESGIPIDMLFTDVVMPGPLRSPDLARKAKQRLPNLAVLFTSGYTENAIVHHGRLDPGVELLSKPYTREALARKVRHVLGNQAQQQLAHGNSEARPSYGSAAVAQAAARRLKVVLVEDDALIRASTADMLQDLGHVVVETRDGDAAMQALTAQDVDVLITDIGLPGVSGVDLAREARFRWPDIAVVFATGDETAIASAGVEGAIAMGKPYTPQMLDEALAQVAAK